MNPASRHTMTKSNARTPDPHVTPTAVTKRQLERTRAIAYPRQPTPGARQMTPGPRPNPRPMTPKGTNPRETTPGGGRSNARPRPRPAPLTRTGSVPRDIHTINTRPGKLRKSSSIQCLDQDLDQHLDQRIAQHPNPTAPAKTVRFTPASNPPIHIQTSEPTPTLRADNKKHKFSKVIKKYWTNLTENLVLDSEQREASHASNSDGSGSRSCPDLHCKRQGSKESLLAPPRSPSSLSDDGSFASPHKLTVPDLFTTSFTHSVKKQPVSRTVTLPVSLSFSSAPDLAVQDLEGEAPKKLSLKKSYSDCPPRGQAGVGASGGDPVPQHRALNWEPPTASRVYENLYLGNLEATQNERLLCKLNIVSVIELDADTDAEASSTHLRPSIPCPCQATHCAPAMLRLSLGDGDLAKFQATLPAINRFMHGALEKDKGVLVYCRHGNYSANSPNPSSPSNALPALTMMQYLISEVGLSLRRAYSAVMKCTSQQLPLRYTSWLESLEALQPVRTSIDLPRAAWTDA